MSHTVLIVDDYPDALELLEVTLGLAGYRSVRATNGRDAVEAARAHRPDAIVMDVYLPLLDGIAAARQIREIDGLARVPIIGYTAQSCRQDDEVAAVFDHVVAKPCAPEVLIGLLADVLHKDCPAGC
jgi:two-component system, OmpR family, alkaline phosphatase synthesis response regulator PhoP